MMVRSFRTKQWLGIISTIRAKPVSLTYSPLSQYSSRFTSLKTTRDSGVNPDPVINTSLPLTGIVSLKIRSMEGRLNTCNVMRKESIGTHCNVKNHKQDH